jgi:hypothetical protein
MACYLFFFSHCGCVSSFFVVPQRSYTLIQTTSTAGKKEVRLLTWMESTRESKRSGAAEDDGFIEVGHDNARHGQAFTASLSSALALGALYITSLQTHGLPHAVVLPFSFLTVLKCVFLCFYFHHPLGLLCCFSHVLKPRNAMRAAKEQSSKETGWASRLLHRLLLKTRP